MTGRIASLAAGSLIAVAAAATLLLHHGAAVPLHPNGNAGYVAALGRAIGPTAPNAAQEATELATGTTICRMLATGWNEAGVVANLWTWPAYAGDPEAEVETIVRITRESLCGQAA